MTKDQIADAFETIARLLELKGENPFKIRAYTQAARALESLAEPLEMLIAEDRLTAIDGIGKATGEKITELHATGQASFPRTDRDGLRDTR